MKTFILAAIAATVPAVASAQDAAPAAPFTGVRAEALGGYDSLSEDVDGGVYGGAIGYDAAVGTLTLGVEGEITGTTAKVTERDAIVANDRLRLKGGRDLYVGGRVGFLLSPTALAYGKAGYTNARINVDYSGNANAFSQNLDSDGFRLGAGLELQVSPNVYVKGEYRYSNYKEIEDIEVDQDRHQIVGGVGFRF